MSFDSVQIALCVVGAFYAFGGYIATRGALTAHFVDRAIAALGGSRPDRIEVARTWWLLVTATLVLAGGVALLLLLDIAAWLFLASALGQAAYLVYVAPRIFDVAEPPDAAGRRQTTNAFVIYAAATAFVLWALSEGRLTSWREAGWPLLALFAAVVAAHIGYVVWTVRGGPKASPLPGALEKEAGEGDEIGNDPGRDPAQSMRIKVMADYCAHPLWSLDEDSYGDFPPERLALSPDLTRDLNAWAEAFTSSLDPDNPGESRWSDAQHRTHEAEARPLAVRLARECPDRMIYIMDAAVGVVQVHADDEI